MAGTPLPASAASSETSTESAYGGAWHVLASHDAELVGAVLSTSTFAGAESAWLPAASYARATIFAPPSGVPVVSQLPAYGELVAVPCTLPPTRNSTRSIPPLSMASAASATVPDRIDPSAGPVS